MTKNKENRKDIDNKINLKIEQIKLTALKFNRILTDKQARQIEEKSQQLIWEGKRQSERAGVIKTREINLGFEQREYQKQMN